MRRQGRLPLFLPQAQALQTQPAFVQDRDHQIFFKCIRNGITGDGNSHNPHNSPRSTHSQKQPLCIRQGVGGGSGVLVVLLYPFGDAQILCRQPLQDLGLILRLGAERQLRAPLFQGVDNRPVKEPIQLLCGQLQALPLAAPLLELLAVLQQQLRIVAFLRRASLACVLTRLARELAITLESSMMRKVIG